MTTVYKMLSDKTPFFYIGCTSKPLSYRHSGHKQSFKTKDFKLYRKIKSLGLTIDDFMLVKIKELDNKTDGLELEHFIIKQNIDNPYMLNHFGAEKHNLIGTTHTVSQETRDKISKANKGQIPWVKGKKQTLEHIEKRAKALRGKKLSEDHKRKLRERNKGKPAKFKEVTCPHCDKIGKENVMYRWHFDNCKRKVS